MLNKEKILLHVCCAPCATACIERLLEHGRDVSLYYSNSNINSQEEFEKRLSYVEQVAGIFDVPLFVDTYTHADWLSHVRGLESEPEKGLRCVKCFNWSLSRTAQKANELNITNFATTLTVSPHKISRIIFEQGNRLPGFEEWDFKKKEGFKRSKELSIQFDLYRQNYCGCEFSIR
jgi:predicted adenine nucleotide alpha hydrolase (AANH) superfamily ATPase